MRRGNGITILTSAAVIALVAAAHGHARGDSETLPTSGLTAEELPAQPTAPNAGPPSDPWNRPVAAAEAPQIEVEALAEVGYVDEQGRYIVDLLERDYAYLAVRATTPEGRPIQGAVPRFAIAGTSELLEPKAIASEPVSNEVGIVEFAVIGGQMGLDRVTVEVGDATTEILINVISLQAAGFPEPPVIDGGLAWQQLMQARIRYQDQVLVAEFPAVIHERAGETVKVSGFMLPLEPELRQRRFLLTSNPPSCFFHVPGGPAGAVEVFAKEGIEVSWDPVVLEGRFEPQRTSEVGVVYRLHDARLVKP